MGQLHDIAEWQSKQKKKEKECQVFPAEEDEGSPFYVLFHCKPGNPLDFRSPLNQTTLCLDLSFRVKNSPDYK